MSSTTSSTTTDAPAASTALTAPGATNTAVTVRVTGVR
jgi:hypothetical protein